MNNLCNGRNVYLDASEVIPFGDSFPERVVKELRVTDGSVRLESMVDTGEAPGKLLVKMFNQEAHYREHMSYAAFLNQNGTLTDRLIHVVIEGDSRLWINFIKEYIKECKTCSVSKGLFLLEASSLPMVPLTKSERTLRCHDFVTEYDTLLFAGLILDNNTIKHSSKRYITALSVSFFNGDAEMIADFIQNFKIYDDPEVLFGSQFSDIAQRIWIAQVQELFPVVVRETHKIINILREEIQVALDYIKSSGDFYVDYQDRLIFKDGLLNANSEPIEDPDEMEIGTLKFLSHLRRQEKLPYYAVNRTNEYLLYVSDPELRKHIELLSKVRNRIAHGKVCPVEDVLALLGEQ